MSTDPEPDYEIFEDYLGLPNELRMMIIDRMEPDDRCRFSRCSKLCNKEAKASKNYIQALKLNAYHADKINIKVVYGENPCYNYQNFGCGYDLMFSEYEGKKYIECRRIVLDINRWLKVLWKIDLDDSVNLAQLATDHFIKLLKVHQNTIKCLEIDGIKDIFEHKNVNFGIERLNNLEELVVFTDADISQFVPKIRKTLKSLIVQKEENIRVIADWEEIYNIREALFLPHLKLNNQQFLRLSSFNVEIHIGELTEEDISDFIRSWQNGKIEINSGSYAWILENSDFDVKKLVTLLGVPNHRIEVKDLKMKKLDEPGSMASLNYDCDYRALIFRTYFAEELEDYDKDEEEEEESEEE